VVPHAIEIELLGVRFPACPDSPVWIDVLVNASNLHSRSDIVEFLGYSAWGLARFWSGEPALDAEIEFSGFGSLPQTSAVEAASHFPGIDAYLGDRRQ